MKQPILHLFVTAALLCSPVILRADAEDEFRMARNLFRDAGDYATAAPLFADFIRNRPGDPHLAEAQLMLARAYARSNRCTQAVAAYGEFYEAHPDHLAAAEARREQAACYEHLGDAAQAGAIYEEVQRLYSESEFAAEALLAAARNYVRAGDLTNGLRAYDKLLRDYDGHVAARRGRHRLAQLRLAAGDVAGARALLARVVSGAPTSDEARDALLLAGRLELFLHRTKAAEALFDQLQSSFATSSQADSARLDLSAHYASRSQYEQAARAYADAADRIADPQLQARARLGQADALRADGRHDEALDVYRKLLRFAPATALIDQIQLGMAVSLGWRNQVGPAVAQLFQLIRSTDQTPTPVAATALRELGALYRRQGDLARAISWLRRYLEEAERYGDAFPEPAAQQDLVRLHLAQVYAASGYHDEAIQLFTTLSRNGGLQAEGQYGLATAYEGGRQRQRAVREFMAFLERYPGHRRSAQVRERVEYLRECTVNDAEGLAQAVRQATIDDLSGRPRQRVRFDLAVALRRHQDFPNAVRAWETYVGAYPEDLTSAEAQFYLADCLYRLARQRQLENAPTVADSLRDLARQEDRILGASQPSSRWSRLAQLRQIERAAAEADNDSARYRIEEDGYTVIVAATDTTSLRTSGGQLNEAQTRALLGLGDARRRRAQTEPSRLPAAIDAYQTLLDGAGNSPLAPRARFGLAAARLQSGATDVAIDSLTALLQDVPGSDLQPQVLAVLSQALHRAGRARAATARLSELLLAFPAYEGRRQAEEQLADTYLEIGENSRAAELFERLADSDPDGDLDGSVRRRLARAYFQGGDFERSLNIADQLLAEGLTAADSVNLARGDALARLQRTQEAITAYQTIGATAPLGSRAARLAADLLFSDGDFAAAARAYGALATTDGADAPLVGRWVLSLYEEGQSSAAKKARNQFRKRFGKNQTTWAFLFDMYEGRQHLAAHEYDKSYDLFAKLAEQAAAMATGDEPVALGSAVPSELARMVADPVAAAAYYAATARWQQMRAAPSEEGAAAAMKAQSDFLRAHGTSPFAPNVQMRLGDFQTALGSYRPAAGAYRAVLDGTAATLTQRQAAIWKLQQCYAQLFEYDEALRFARRLLNEFPDHPHRRDAQLAIGIIYEESGRYAEAINYLTDVLKWAEGNDAAEARFYIGEAYRNRGDYRLAIQTYYEVSYHGADASTNWIVSADFSRARCYEELAETATAISVYEKIIRAVGASSTFGRLARERIDAL